MRSKTGKLAILFLLLMSGGLAACQVKEKQSASSTELSVSTTQTTANWHEEPTETSTSKEKRLKFKKQDITLVNWTMRHDVLQYNYKQTTTEAELQLYQQLMADILAQKASIALSNSHDTNLKLVGLAQQNPLYFLIADFQLAENNTKIVFTYRYDQEEQARIMTEIEAEFNTIFNEVLRGDYNDLEKILALYQYFAKRIQYDYAWYEAYSQLSAEEKLQLILNKEDHGINMYQALSSNQGVCHSYAYLMQYALHQLEIENVVVEAEEVEGTDGHAWNQIKLGENFYHFDLTWDSERTTTQQLGSSLQYFGMTDDERQQERQFTSPIVEEAITCNAETFQAFRSAEDFVLLGNHRVKLQLQDGRNVVYDTNSLY